MATFAGFDTEYFPGDALMTWLHANSNLKWCGYYLAPAPNRSPTGWTGRYRSLSAKWGVVPIYVGQQDPRTATARYVPSSVLTSDQGSLDAKDAGNLALADRFPPGTFIYLDWEYGALDANGAQDYIRSWVAAVMDDGRYMPGIYCSHLVAPNIVPILDLINPAPGVRFWCWKVPTTNAHPFTGDLTAVPAPDPSGCGFAGADSWQRDQNTIVTLGGDAPVRSMQVDFNTSSLANPAAPLAAYA